MSGRILTRAGTALLLLVFVGLHGAAIFTVAFNWDEFATFDRVARSLHDGLLRASAHAGLTEIVLSPFVEGCRDEIAVGRAARGVWLGLTLLYLAGIAALLAELLRESPRRLHDTALGVALLGLLPAFLEWSLQVRSDHIALVGASWGGAALLASRRRPALALCAGLGFGVGWLSSQKAAYVGALVALLALAQLLERREWRPRRELVRGALAVGVFCAVVFGYAAAIGSAFTLPENHPTGAVPEPALVKRHLDVFAHYRRTIGYRQYVELLPTLIPHFALLGLLVAATAVALKRRAQRARVAVAWAVLALGAAVGAFHAAAFAYFWLTLGLFPALALALALAPIRGLVFAQRARWLQPAGAVLWIALALPAALQAPALLLDTQAVQRESLTFVHRNFSPSQAGFQPERALFCGASQPFGGWMSFNIYEHFGGEQREANTRSLLARFREEPLHYLVQSFRLNQFPVELRRFWADNYQPYRASVFVAGRRLAGARGEARTFDIVVPGLYRWLPVGNPLPVRIDGRVIEAAATLALGRGEHEASFLEDTSSGLLVLALNDPPGPAPLAFYKTY
ncbi:MAG TPA: hypothetical protein VIY27_09660 [Myxococcota bacterium]